MKIFSYVVLLILVSTTLHNGFAAEVAVVDPTLTMYQKRQAILRQQGEDEIKRRHELALAKIKAEILASKLQLEAGNINVYSSSYSSAGIISKTRTTNTNRTTQTNENN